MEIDRKELKRQSRERMAITDPKFWVVALVYIALTTGVSWIISFIPTPDGSMLQLFFRLLLNLYETVVSFGLCLWALWTWRQLDPGINSLIQGFSVAGRVVLMELGIFIRTLGWYLPAALGLSLPLFAVLMTTASDVAAVLAIVLFAVALIAVLIVVSLRYALAPYLLADRPDDGASIPIYRSVQLMRGWKMELFKLELSFIGWEAINLLLSIAVIVFFFYQAGLLSAAAIGTTAWLEQCNEVFYSAPVTILSTLVTIPVYLWLLPYRSVARAGFYDARIQAAAQERQAWSQLPPL